MSCGVGHQRDLDPVLLWLWHRLAAVALLQPLAWEFPYAAGAALKTKKKKPDKKSHQNPNPSENMETPTPPPPGSLQLALRGWLSRVEALNFVSTFHGHFRDLLLGCRVTSGT